MSLGARETAEAVARAAYGHLLAYLSARSRDVARARRKIRDELAVAAARDVLGGIARCILDHALIGQTGRTSIEPVEAPGHFAAQASAASRSGTSIMKKPPSCSLVSA